jgi:hypothetical protein
MAPVPTAFWSWCRARFILSSTGLIPLVLRIQNEQNLMLKPSMSRVWLQWQLKFEGGMVPSSNWTHTETGFPPVDGTSAAQKLKPHPPPTVSCSSFSSDLHIFSETCTCCLMSPDRAPAFPIPPSLAQFCCLVLGTGHVRTPRVQHHPVSSSSAALLSLTEVRNYLFRFCRADRG